MRHRPYRPRSVRKRQPIFLDTSWEPIPDEPTEGRTQHRNSAELPQPNPLDQHEETAG